MGTKTRRVPTRTAWALGLLGLLTTAACAEDPPAPPSEPLGEVSEAVFSNGNFETGAANSPPPGWTVTPYMNLGVTSTTPATRADLQLQSGGSAQTFLLTGTVESVADSALGTGASLRYPKYGSGVAVVNVPGASRNTNSLKQSMTISAGDVDPADGKAHVRFTVAPVLENPGHAANQQPYYFVQLRNTTRNTVLYKDYNASAQPGIPWKISNGVYYTDWQLVDIAPGSAELALGDEVELEVIAAGCSQGGHFGRVYVDGIGSTVPGLFVSATGPASANAGSNVTYTLAYTNGGTGGASAAAVDFVTPPSTTFVSVSGASCSQPSVGSTGTVSCPLGALSAGGTGSLQVTVKIDSGATGKITNGNYAIKATGISPLVGPKVYTTITSGVAYADLSLTKTNGVGGVAWGQSVSYAIVVSNAGPSAVTGATVTDALPATLTGATWTCAGAGGASCTASGTGSIADSAVNVPVGGSVTYTLGASVVAGTGNGTLSNTASVTVPSGYSDSNPANNAAGDSDPIGPLRSLTFSKAGSGAGSVGSVPAAIACDASCSGASASFVDGATVILSATAAPGDTFEGWAGACTGKGSCSLTMSADISVTATFSSPLAGNGSACGQGSECSSGQCIDGVCCNTACGSGASDCQACDLPGHVGSCTPIAAGTECRASAGICDSAESCDGASAACPSDAKIAAGTECRASAGICDSAESCDGASAACPSDAKIAAGTECRAATCDGGTESHAASCDGSSAACAPSTTATCGAFVCGTTACLTGCASDAQCADGSFCSANGACEPKIALGTACDADRKCTSGHCIDGVCCDTACDGQCEACDAGENAGTCTAIAGAPRGDREACGGDGSLCNGTCDGMNRAACSFKGADVECRNAACSEGTATYAASCDGAGSCPAMLTQDCGAFVCGDEQCLGDCDTDTDCSSGNFCSAGVCLAKRSNGDACYAGNECGSGFCADGTCCDTKCDGQCEACDVLGDEGACVPVVGAPHGARPECASDGTVCGGACGGDDREACDYSGAETSCRAASCTDGVAIVGASCDGAGSCPGQVDVACAPFLCGEDVCDGDCAADSDCAEGHFCQAGLCTRTEELGDTCSGANECASGHCVDGVCCDTACEGQCEACDLDERAGTCSPASGQPHGARAACASDTTVCGGFCDGEGRDACAYPADETACRSAECADGVATLGATCDGNGACPTLEEQSCGGFECGETSCLGECAMDRDCSAGHYCSAGICVDLRARGATCGAEGECASGHCVDGVCCDTSCDGQCEACDERGSLGTCVPVTGAPRGGRAACGGQGTCAGECGGEERDSCAFPGASTTCEQASCSDGVATPGASCDGHGACAASPTQGCDGFECEGTACATECGEDADCRPDHVCVDSACLSGSRADDVATDLVGLQGGCSCQVPAGGEGAPWRGLLGVAIGVALMARARRRRG